MPAVTAEGLAELAPPAKATSTSTDPATPFGTDTALGDTFNCVLTISYLRVVKGAGAADASMNDAKFRARVHVLVTEMASKRFKMKCATNGFETQESF